jgi:tetratricopeptide (TPR) repeat protein
MLRANSYFNARRYRRAYELYAELGDAVAKEDKEDQALYHFYYAESAFGIREYDEYLSHLRKAIELDKESYESALVDAFVKVAEKHNQAGKLDKYIEYLGLAVAESPETASLHLRLADGYEEAKQYQQAVQQWRMVLDLEPDHPDRTRLLNLIKKHLRAVETDPSSRPGK